MAEILKSLEATKRLVKIATDINPAYDPRLAREAARACMDLFETMPEMADRVLANKQQ